MDAAIALLGAPTRTVSVLGRRVALYNTDCMRMLHVPFQVDLVVTSPPYNIGKAYAQYADHRDNFDQWLGDVIRAIAPRLRRDGSLMMNVGYSSDHVPIAYKMWNASPALKMHQEIIWSFSRGVAARHYYSPRHETILWWGRSQDTRPRFTLDNVREPHDQSTCTCGTRNGRKRCNPDGKNPGDVWFVQTIAAGAGRAAQERVAHPTQMPLHVATRMVAGCGIAGGVLLDPFCGSGTSLVAAVQNGMDAIGFDIDDTYLDLCVQRLEELAE